MPSAPSEAVPVPNSSLVRWDRCVLLLAFLALAACQTAYPPPITRPAPSPPAVDCAADRAAWIAGETRNLLEFGTAAVAANNSAIAFRDQACGVGR